MGRSSVGARSINSALIIDLSDLLKRKGLIKGVKLRGTFQWGKPENTMSEIGFESCYKPDDAYIKLMYTVTENDNQIIYDYNIKLIQVNSNLGKGTILYMCCPQSGAWCRKLYMAYGSHIFKARQAYKNRLYYPLQMSSKNDRYNNRYWQLDRQIEKAHKERATYKYNGKITKRAEKITRLENARWKYDELRYQQLVICLERMKVKM